jgi:hypothetical protein
VLHADWAAEMARLEKAIKESPNPIRRHQPRIKRMQSRRMQIVSRQQPNLYKAGFELEKEENRTPIVPNDKLMIWPKDMKQPKWSTGKSTQER